ncbi:prepilin-type N-terminal cleavage/methylation domain-containing protein [[Clostridium] fimetarium]|uniref:Prepilin-type N-terminal cleavage/methylation domain-containing protein n=2 Tax=[Clostridium] fimetarium TaxID=99656 RepID=A0A1I0N0B8_9FIRM|nr:prepilin-type N-terminal cleavage/methylation domain-containing protein [[Clostridium] fimetarium]
MMNESQKVNKNAGFSLVELIVVVTIIAIMVGGSFAGFAMLARGDSKKAVKNISSQITELRTNTLSVAGNWFAEIYKKDNTYRIDIKKKITLPDGKTTSEELVSSTAIGSKIVISYVDSVFTDKKDINDSNKLVISFMQGSGKVNQVKLVNSDLSETPLIGPISQSGNIIVSVKSSTSNSLTLWYLTGKLTTDY